MLEILLAGMLLTAETSEALHARLANMHLHALGIFQQLEEPELPTVPGCDFTVATSEDLQAAVAVDGAVVCVDAGTVITSPIKIRNSTTLTGGPVLAQDVAIGFDLFHLDGSHRIEFIEFAFGQMSWASPTDFVFWLRGDVGSEPDELILEAVTLSQEDTDGNAQYAGFDIWGKLDATLKDFDFVATAESDRNTSFLTISPCANWLVEGGRFHGTRSAIHLEGGSSEFCLGASARNGSGAIRGVVFERSGPQFDNAAGFIFAGRGDGQGPASCDNAHGDWVIEGNAFTRGAANRVSRAVQGALYCETASTHPGTLTIRENLLEGDSRLLELNPLQEGQVPIRIITDEDVHAPGYPR